MSRQTEHCIGAPAGLPGGKRPRAQDALRTRSRFEEHALSRETEVRRRGGARAGAKPAGGCRWRAQGRPCLARGSLLLCSTSSYVILKENLPEETELFRLCFFPGAATNAICSLSYGETSERPLRKQTIGLLRNMFPVLAFEIFLMHIVGNE